MIKNMQTEQVLSLINLKEDKYEFLSRLLENCGIGESTDQLYCKRCRTLVHIDWSRELAFCKMHIISRSGVNLKERQYEIYV